MLTLKELWRSIFLKFPDEPGLTVYRLSCKNRDIMEHRFYNIRSIGLAEFFIPWIESLVQSYRSGQ